MKTKEQKRQEANQRHHDHLKRILKVGGVGGLGLGYLQKRLVELDSKPGKCEAERVRIEKAIYKLQEAEKQSKMSVKELKSESKKSKGGK